MALWQVMRAATGALQVETSIVAEKQSLEMPCVAPSLVGRPHRHAYFQSSRIAEASNWGAPQVTICLFSSRSASSKGVQYGHHGCNVGVQRGFTRTAVSKNYILKLSMVPL